MKRKNVYKGRSRSGGKDLDSLNHIIKEAKLPEEELDIAMGLQEIGFFMERFNKFPAGRALMIFGGVWFGFNMVFWALDTFMLEGEMFAVAWIAIVFMGIMAIPAAIIVPAYFGYMKKAVPIRMKINKVRKHIGMDEVQFKKAMFSSGGGDEKPVEEEKPAEEDGDEPVEEDEKKPAEEDEGEPVEENEKKPAEEDGGEPVEENEAKSDGEGEDEAAKEDEPDEY